MPLASATTLLALSAPLAERMVDKTFYWISGMAREF